MRYKHYSFDLWLTLIKSQVDNKGINTFKERRANYIRNHTGQKHTTDHVYTVIREIELGADKWNQISGENTHPFQMYTQILTRLGRENINKFDLMYMYSQVEDMFLREECIPKVYDSSTTDTLKRIKDSGATLSILSNTGFIMGPTLRKVLSYLNLDEYFDFMLFSDEINMSKPSSNAFDMILSSYNGTITHRDICHVGDSMTCDYEGAIKAGMNAFIINSNFLTIKDVV